MKYNPLCALLKNLVASDIPCVGKILNFFISFGLEELVLDIVKLFLKFSRYKLLCLFWYYFRLCLGVYFLMNILLMNWILCSHLLIRRLLYLLKASIF